MIFVDSNIPMYLIGAPHRHKDDARRLLERFVAERIPLVTDAEVFQEILHRYVAIDRRDAIKPHLLCRRISSMKSIQFNSQTTNAPATSYSANENSPPEMPFM